MDTRIMVEIIDARLRYLLSECPPEEYNMAEVNALINLLKEYDPEDSRWLHIDVAERHVDEMIYTMVYIVLFAILTFPK